MDAFGRGLDWLSVTIALYRMPMAQKLPTVENVLAALPRVQEAVKREVAARIAAGEDIAALDLKRRADRPVRTRPTERDRTAKRKSAA
jgi:hypothetical protein